MKTRSALINRLQCS